MKSFVIDNSTAFIMSLNLTSPYVRTRDYAVSTTDAGVVAEFEAVFAADLVNAQNATATTAGAVEPIPGMEPGELGVRGSPRWSTARRPA